MSLLKGVIVELTFKEEYKTHKILISHNPNARKFDIRALNEDIAQEAKYFTKCIGMFCNVFRTSPRKLNEEQSIYTYRARYIDNFNEPYVIYSRICAIYIKLYTFLS